MNNYLNEIQNPYCYTENGVTVRISFAGKKLFSDCINEFLKLQYHLTEDHSFMKRIQIYNANTQLLYTDKQIA